MPRLKTGGPAARLPCRETILDANQVPMWPRRPSATATNHGGGAAGRPAHRCDAGYKICSAAAQRLDRACARRSCLPIAERSLPGSRVVDIVSPRTLSTRSCFVLLCVSILDYIASQPLFTANSTNAPLQVVFRGTKGPLSSSGQWCCRHATAYDAALAALIMPPACRCATAVTSIHLEARRSVVGGRLGGTAEAGVLLERKVRQSGVVELAGGCGAGCGRIAGRTGGGASGGWRWR
jgi:hypothetical protein